MILGMTLAAFTTLHVIISLVAIAAGVLAVVGLLAAKRMPLINTSFLVLTALTSITGFLFPFKGVTPGIVVGILSMVVLALAATARYVGHMAGGWRGTYVVSAAIALYFNVFVFIVHRSKRFLRCTTWRPHNLKLPSRLFNSSPWLPSSWSRFSLSGVITRSRRQPEHHNERRPFLAAQLDG